MAKKEFIERDSTLLKMWNALYALEDEQEKQNGNDIKRRLDVQAGFEAGQSVVANEPSTDVVERKKGCWITAWVNGVEFQHCTECGAYVQGIFFANDYDVNFCPSCGADMREDNNG